ncbi:DinB family protein [Microlunatus capsulatus]|uniref:Damage-inducible protein DinB n=1 Tax=Microlunatus capsulatus TaxID=99117 RepID=A0ABS4ZD13_9ACTN|nr:DinB family protein [Microlunatus capsulatus]MBP2418922.1 putative damage-inducible protein DinB [Microlunatus capsulatus]
MVTGPDTDERRALLHFLAANRRSALQVVDGLSEADARRSVVPSGWTPFDLLVHLGGVERHWFLLVLDGDTTDAPASPGEVSTLVGAAVSYRAECERSDQILTRFALDDPLTVQPEQLVGEVTTVRGVLLHVIEEIARHVGHLDLARELLDGLTGLGPR